MKSAYLLLGVPGNATADDIAAAFAKAKAHYTPQHMADTPGALERFNEVKTAYEILRNPDTRAAHDRKLLAGTASRAAARPVYVADEGMSPGVRMLLIGGVVVALMFGTGFYFSNKRQAAAAALAAQELAVRQQEEAEKQAAHKRDIEADRERSRVAAQEAARARQMDYENRAALSRSHADQSRAMALEATARREQASLEQREQREQRAQQQALARANSEREQRERRLAFEAQRRLATDKQRIRELCMQEYRRPDC
jgi:curved DNA-binding protein CbpA